MLYVKGMIRPALCLIPLAALGFWGALAGVKTSKASPIQVTSQDSRALFERRILPIFKSSSPSTCSECHLSGVDLKDYIRPTEAETFASLVAQGYIDTKKPAESRLLKLISMSTPRSALITRKARNMEYEAFRAWIVAAVQHAPANDASPKPIGPKVPVKVIRHTRLDRVVDSFTRNIWSQEGRCMGCHRPGTSDNDRLTKKYGDRVRWFVPDDPEATMKKIIAQNLINVKNPADSLLLLKPMNKVAHEGGVKFVYGDTTYQMFRAWIEDYAKSVQGSYRSEKDLPARQKFGIAYTESLLEVSQTPDDWVDKTLCVDLFAWNARAKAWNKEPVATGERQVGANHATNILLFRIVQAGSAEEKAAWKRTRLEGGKYLMKYYVNKKSPSSIKRVAPTDDPEFYQGQQTVTSEWKTGWGDMTKVSVALTGK